MSTFIENLASIADHYDMIISDVWGVLHNGVQSYPAAYEALSAMRKAGKPVVLVSNAPRPGDHVIPQLIRLGVPRDCFDHIVTSGDVSRSIMKMRPESAVHHIGPSRDTVVFDGLDKRLVSLEEANYVVITGLVDDSVETPDDYRAILSAIRMRNLTVICGNPDKVVEVGNKLVYCAGALGDLYSEMGGSVIYAGKPFAPIYEMAKAFVATADRSVPVAKRILAIGDAMRTDITGAQRMGFDSLFLAEGIHGHVLLKNGQWIEGAFDRLLTENNLRPTYVMKALT